MRIGENLTDRKVRILLYIYILSLVGGIGIYTRIGLDLIFYIFTASMLVLLSYTTIIRFNEILIDKYFFIMILVYYFWLLISMIAEPRPQQLLYAFSTPLVIVSIIFLLPSVTKDKYFLPYVFSVLGAVLVIIGLLILGVQSNTEIIYSPHTGRSALGIDGVRISSVFYNSNNFSKLACVSAISSLYLMMRNVEYSKFMSALNFLGVALSGSEAALIGFFTGISLLLFYKKSIIIIYTGLLAAGTFLFAIFVGWVDNVQFAQNLSGRNYIWQASLRVILENPSFGIDYTSADEKIAVHIPDEGSRYRGYGSHNTFIAVFLMNGIVGGLAYSLSMVYVLVIGSLNIDSIWDGYILATLCALIVTTMFSTVLLGGFSVDSLLLATFIGFVLKSANEH